MIKTNTAMKLEVRANTSELKVRLQWMRAAAKGQTKLGFTDWYSEQLDRLISSWMVK